MVTVYRTVSGDQPYWKCMCGQHPAGGKTGPLYGRFETIRKHLSASSTWTSTEEDVSIVKLSFRVAVMLIML